MRTIEGTLFCYSATGEGPHLCFYSNEEKGGFWNTYDYTDAEMLEVYDKDGKILWRESPKGRKVFRRTGYYFIIPDAVTNPERFVDWCFAEFPAKITGNLKSWAEKQKTN